MNPLTPEEVAELLRATAEEIIKPEHDLSYLSYEIAHDLLVAATALDAAQQKIEELGTDLVELSQCVMHGWTDPAFCRSRRHNRAVEIARNILAPEEVHSG